MPAPTVTLRPMTEAEWAAEAERLQRGYADDMHAMGGVPLETARQRARESFDELAPGGRLGPDHAAFVAVDAAGERVGFLWLARRAAGTEDAHAWIYDIEVDAGRRGEGLGRALLTAAEDETRRWGLRSLRLNVFGGNAVARALYESAGFAVTDLRMAKDVGQGD